MDPMSAFKAAMDVHISYKFGGLLSGILQLMLLNCVQQASISSRVNSSTSTRGQHVCVSLLLARGRYCLPRGLYTRLCYAFIVKFSLFSFYFAVVALFILLLVWRIKIG